MVFMLASDYNLESEVQSKINLDNVEWLCRSNGTLGKCTSSEKGGGEG